MAMTLLLVETGLAGATGTGLVLATAGLAKVRHRALLPGVVANYRLLPDALIAPVAALLPPGELALGAGMIVSGLSGGLLRPLGFIAAALFLVFAGAMAINVRRGRTQIDCGCGHSGLRQPIGPALVARNLVLAAFALVHALAGSADPALAGTNLAIALVAGACLYLLTELFNALVALAASPLANGRR